jgi:hypothetical protein
VIGTLAVSLPSSHTGGGLVIEHDGKTVACQASATEVPVAAFCAGCRPEVRPVRTGYRVTFTCNLLARRVGSVLHGVGADTKDIGLQSRRETGAAPDPPGETGRA